MAPAQRGCWSHDASLVEIPSVSSGYLSGARMNLHLPSAEPHETLPTPAGRSGGVDFPYGPKGPADKDDSKDNLAFDAAEISRPCAQA